MSRALLIVSLLASLAGCSAGLPEAGSRPSVVAGFYPLAFAARAVGGDRIEVTDLTPQGAEPHDLELTPSQAAEIAEADLVLYLGGFQPALEDAVDAAGPEGVDLLRDVSGAGDDPHVWLDPLAMADLIDEITEQLAELDPGGATAFESRARRLRDRLEHLDADYAAGLEGCASRDLVVSHEAFGHLAARYGLEQTGISGIDPEAEPAPGRLAEVARLAEVRGVTTVFFERLVSPDVAEALAREVGAETAVLEPIEGAPATGDYFTAMEANLDALRAGLQCP
ncbi:MAG: metal ABC transporter substrate-binding protein [Actinomycetota bacterium]|nr:metal ABC transporter substrate-binding protein [Actinomycetota bacterium]